MLVWWCEVVGVGEGNTHSTKSNRERLDGGRKVRCCWVFKKLRRPRKTKQNKTQQEQQNKNKQEQHKTQNKKTQNKRKPNTQRDR